ncbi:MAG: plasmid pRiA4b ORF-3 family protein [Candidatus Poribacteria bacterium]|nr:plasmid pRiA4b ORF-3 family protein [Candidatus Poribacteria bacterium]
MSTQQQTAEPSIYQLKVSLKGSKPPIWRRIQVQRDTRLDALHHILQVVMGWEDSHLHQFTAGGVYYGTPDPDFGFDEAENEADVALDQVVSRVKQKLTYEYDFGDSWEHELILEKILPPKAGADYPICLTGKRACPPEDCGGIWGYYDFLQAIEDPNHPDHDDMLEWVGGAFDPEAFDRDEINGALKQMKSAS